MRPSSRRLLRVLLALLGAFVGLLLAEIGLRLLGAPSPAASAYRLHVARPDRAWLYGLRPRASAYVPAMGELVYRVNAEGFRDRARSRTKSARDFRMLVLGDSIAFGFGVELRDAFPAQLEARVRALVPERTVQALNFGVSGYNPYTEAALLEDAGAAWQPDLVLVQFSINDLGDPTLGFDLHTRLEVGPIPDAAYPDPRMRTTALRVPDFALRACERSRLCAALDALWRARGVARYALPNPGPGDPVWPWLDAQYGRMAAEAERIGAGFALVAFPSPEQVGGADGSVPEQLRALGARRGFAVVDLLPAFRDAAGPASPLFRDIWHPTPLGHHVAARATAHALLCGGLLPAAAGADCR